jgi:hypothetical protein
MPRTTLRQLNGLGGTPARAASRTRPRALATLADPYGVVVASEEDLGR